MQNSLPIFFYRRRIESSKKISNRECIEGEIVKTNLYRKTNLFFFVNYQNSHSIIQS